MEFNEQLQKTLHLLEKGKDPLFITGKAGTGKSTLLSHFLSATQKNVAVLAPTGVAALNVKGMTIHSFFGFRPGITVEKAREKGRKAKGRALLRALDLIVIDEISMVRADLLDCIDAYLRAALNKAKPFGGIRMVFIGDLYQLSPVLTSHEREFFQKLYPSPYFFSAKVMQETSFELIELEKIYRQSDAVFIEVLNAIRKNCATQEHLEWINRRVLPFDGEGFLYLSATTKEADQINWEKLQQLPSKCHTFQAEIEGEFEEKHAPTDRELKIKEGAQVMLLNNHPEGLWVNGTVGIVKGIQKEEILIEKQEGGTIQVSPYKWTLYKYHFEESSLRVTQDEVGSFLQYPLCLAWGITIHKSQGKTFERVVVDLSRSFAPGQAYVALSRCRSFDGLVLKKPLQNSQIRIDYQVVQFLTKWQYAVSEERCPVEEKIDLIHKAIQEEKALQIVYLKNNDEKSNRLISPLSAGPMEYQGKKYLGMEAYCLLRNEKRIFRIDRILEINKVDL